MKTILFVPCNALQVRRFALVKKRLPQGVNVISVSNRNFIKLGAEEELEKEGMGFVRLSGLSIRHCDKILDKCGAGIVVLGNDSDYISYLFALAAKKRGIPSLMVQDGAIASLNAPPRQLSLGHIGNLARIYTPHYMFGRGAAKLYSRISGVPGPMLNRMGTYCTGIAAWGGFSKRIFLARGAPESALHVTGNPTFDEIAGKKASKAKSQQQHKSILYATSDMAGARLWSKDEVRQAAENVAAAAESIGAKLILRPHPSENKGIYALLGNRYSGLKIQGEGRLYDAIRQADAVLADISTVAFEAILLGKPVGIVNFTGREVSSNYPQAYVKSGAALPISGKGDAASQLRRMLHDKKTASALQKGRERFIRGQAGRLDGKASKRVADLIMALMKN